MAAGAEVEVRRVYDDGGPSRGETRVLVDRLWPRGVKRDDLGLHEWAKDLAPSDGLRRWYGHDVERFGEFRRRYHDELRRPPASEAVDRVLAARGRLVLLTATRDVEHSGAAVLATHLRRRRR